MNRLRHWLSGLAKGGARHRVRARRCWGFCLVAALSALGAPAQADTLRQALASAYRGNPQLNAERARLRGTDEAVPQALSGYRPQIIASLSSGLQSVRNLLPDGTVQSGNLRPWSVGVTVTQTLFNGFRTANSVRQAESQVFAGRQALRNVGQSVLLDAVTAYANVFANQTLVEAQRANIAFLRETLAQARLRYRTGDIRPTDVSQAEARLARGQADLNQAEVNLAVSRATYAQVIGMPVGHLAAAEPFRLTLHSREEAIATSRREHPAILAAMHDIDTAQYAIRIAESALYPNANVQGAVSRSASTDTTLGTSRTDQASVIAQVNVPIYDGGLAAAQTRQAKEVSSQSRLVLEQIRNQAETAVVSAWVTHQGAEIAVTAGQTEVTAATLALQGVQRELQAGQRTTLDVLNAQQDVMGARARLILAQRDRVIASYTLLSAIGHLDIKHLGLDVPEYAFEVHYHQVRDAWHGVRTPSGQ